MGLNQGLLKMSDETRVRDRVFIHKDHREIYQKIRTKHGPLQGYENVNTFLIAMMMGYELEGKEGLKKDIPRLSDGLIRTISFNNDTWDLIKSFSVFIEEDINVLGDINRMLDIAQKYAYFGIVQLNKKYFDESIDFLEYLSEIIDKKFESDDIGF